MFFIIFIILFVTHHKGKLFFVVFVCTSPGSCYFRSSHEENLSCYLQVIMCLLLLHIYICNPTQSQPLTHLHISNPSPSPVFSKEELMDELQPLLEDMFKMDEAQAFKEPVDPVKEQIPDYFEVIKRPMDLGTIRTKLAEGQYETPWNVSCLT